MAGSNNPPKIYWGKSSMYGTTFRDGIFWSKRDRLSVLVKSIQFGPENSVLGFSRVACMHPKSASADHVMPS